MENAILIMAQTYGVSILGYEGCPKHLGGIDSSNLLNNPLRSVLLSKSPFKRWQNHGPGRSSNLPEITQPAKAELILESRQPGSGLALNLGAICQQDQRQGQITEEVKCLVKKEMSQDAFPRAQNCLGRNPALWASNIICRTQCEMKTQVSCSKSRENVQ